MAKSYRLQFRDIDESYSISTATSSIKGYMVVRAPKGTTKATYFEYGNQTAIEAMIGVPSANWPDIYEAESFNNSYGLYISAPAGSSTDSYIGGQYLTINGPIDYYKVTDSTNPNYKAFAGIGNESNCLYNVEDSTVTITATADTKKVTFKIDDDGSSSFKLVTTDDNVTDIILSDDISKNDDNTYNVPKFTCKVNSVAYKSPDTIDAFDDEEAKTSGKEITITESNPSYKDGTITVTVKSDVLKGADYDADSIKATIDEASGWDEDNLTLTITYTGSTVLAKALADYDDPDDAAYALCDYIGFTVDIKDDTFLRVEQKSPTYTQTKVTYSDIGYDKFIYDLKLPYIVYNTDKPGATEASPSIAVCVKDTEEDNDRYILTGIFEKSGPAEDNTYTYTDITENYLTRRILINALDGDEEALEADYNDQIIEVYLGEDEKPALEVMTEDSEEHPLIPNRNYQTITVESAEKVGLTAITGGSYTGSLSETGTDKYGTNIYWPNVLPMDDTSSTSFVNIIPVHTFDELEELHPELWTGSGIFKGLKITEQDYEFSGTRAITAAVEKNIKLGNTGCVYSGNSEIDNVFNSVIKEGLIEAQADHYDDALVFMEPTGREDHKALLATLRQTYHDTSTVISPKIITASQLKKPSTVVVNGRSRGTAQYIGEFKCYDSYTGKNFYCQPIGEVGRMLARIMDLKMGGVAPAGTNDSNGCGGILNRYVLEQKWDINDAALEIFDNKGLNPITFDADYGLMIRSQKTTEDPANGSDWLYLGHSMSFDICKREIRDIVMMPQIFKRINDHWLNIRQNQTQELLNKRITGADPIWATAVAIVNDPKVNNEHTKAKREFNIRVEVKVNVYSETVVLTFVNKGQEA